ncbi:hypothetical protein V8J88_07550 [Massilia sp. W12]|uniref:hypothetical protein n=1 Tax=Massilia sp. W12 TaxID=3126507 RepID=UPI0030D14728
MGDCQIVGAIAVGGGALVTSTSRPYLISGITPDAMTEIALNLWQAGVSKCALADIGGQIVYASHDGIVALDGGQPSLTLSQRFFTRETWRARYGAGLDSMRFAVSDGCLLAYSSRGAFTPFLLRLDEAQGALCDVVEIVTWQACTPGRSTNTQSEVKVNGQSFCKASYSVVDAMSTSHIATGRVLLPAGQYQFSLYVGNDFNDGFWRLERWSVLLLGGDALSRQAAPASSTPRKKSGLPALPANK